MTFLELAKQRYSCKSYSDKPVEEEKLQAILEAARLAPTAKNMQAQRIYVLKSQKALETIDSLTKCRYHAPVVFFLGYEESEEFKNPLDEQYHSGQQDVSIVATHMMLEAAEQGLGTCWINFFPNTKTKEAFGLPESFVPVLLLDLGYPDEDGKPLPNHDKSKDLSAFTKEL